MNVIDTSIVDSLKKEKYLIQFNPKDCDTVYFEDLLQMLDKMSPETERYTRSDKRMYNKSMKTLRCSYPELKHCKKDEFFFHNGRQILLGRYFDTYPCFYKCKDNFFIMSMKTYSFFKNDIFIRYMIDKPNIFVRGKKLPLEQVFPVRILLSKEHKIPTHKTRKIKKTDFHREFIRNTIHDINAISKEDVKIVSQLPDSSVLKRLITSKIPINHIIARELCILYFMDVYFYSVFDDNIPRPYLLVSKYSPRQIKDLYTTLDRPMPDIRLFFHRGKISPNKHSIQSVCLQYNFTTLTQTPEPALRYVKQAITGINPILFKNTLDYLWNYVGNFLLFTCDEEGSLKSFFFQNQTVRPEVEELFNRIKSRHGKQTEKYLEDILPSQKAGANIEIFKSLDKPCNHYCNKNYHKLPFSHPEKWVIMNPIVWAHGHSYRAADYYNSTYYNMFLTLCKKYSLRNKIFFVNYFDGPVLHKKYKYYIIPSMVEHSVNDYYPIYSANTTDEHADIPIPFPDSWEIATHLTFGDPCRTIFREKPKEVNWNQKKSQLIFRGTNTSRSPTDISINTRLFILNQIEKCKNEFPDLFFDAGLTGLIGSTFVNPDGSFEFSTIDKIKKSIPNFKFKPFLPMKEQSEYKYILDIEGVSSSWRLPYLLQTKSCIVNVKSKFTRWFEQFPEFKHAVFHTTKDTFINDMKSLINTDEKAKQIAKKGYIFFTKYFSRESLLDYLYHRCI